MNRILRTLALVLAVLLILASLAAGYLLTGTSSAQTRVHYAIRIADPASGMLDVTLTLQPNPSPFVDLYLRDPVQDGRVRVTQLTVARDGQPLSSWQALPFFPDVIRVWNGFRADPLTLSYRVDPRWMKGAQSPRSYLGPDFGFLRGMVILYSPLSISDILRPDFDHPTAEAGFAEVELSLPDGWALVSPFGSGKIAAPAAALRNSYFGVGKFTTQELEFENSAFLLGVYTGLPAGRREALSRQIPLLFETLRRQAGFAPVSNTCFWSLAVVPPEPIHGGAAGTSSLVAEDNLTLIAHEMFHWWNGSTLSSTPDANWLKEGFTTYYAAKSLYASGLWTQDEMAREVRGFQQKRGAQVSLVEASRQLVEQGRPEAYNPVYYGGAYLAYQLDGLLHDQGKSLDDLWPRLYALNRAVSSADILREIKELGGGAMALMTEEWINGQRW